MNNLSPNRRTFFKSAAFGMMTLSLGKFPVRPEQRLKIYPNPADDGLFYRYPAIHDNDVSAVVGAAHTNFEKVQKLVNNRPELAKASWDWGFGDYESAIGAASHMGRKDIAQLLIDHGARPTIHTYAMMGELEVVQAMIQASPGIQKNHGAHGITLLQHAKNRLWHKDISSEDREKSNAMIKYLESLGNANEWSKSMDVSEEEQAIYFGEYRWGKKDDEVFEVKLIMQNNLAIARKGTFGRVLKKIDQHLFTPGGAPSVQISFVVENGQAISLTIHEPEPIVTAVLVSK